MKKNLFEKLTVIVAIILALVPNYIAPICGPKPDGSFMGCYYSGALVIKIAIAIIIVSLIMIFMNKNKIVKIIGSLVNIVLAFLVYAIPHQIIKVSRGVNAEGKEMFYDFCKKDIMHCIQHHTFEIAGILALIIAIFMIVVITREFLIKKR